MVLTVKPVLLAASPDPGVRRLLRREFTKTGLTVVTADTAAAALEHLAQGLTSVIVMSMHMGDLGGADLIAKIRTASGAPILALVQTPGPVISQMLLDAGADDCLDDPFMPAELAARVRRLLHRQGGLRAYRQIATATGALEVDTVQRQARLGGAPLRLTRKEFDLLAFLASLDSMASTHENILRALWDTDDLGARRNLRRIVGALRLKLETDPHRPDILKSDRGRGYRLAGRTGFDEEV